MSNSWPVLNDYSSALRSGGLDRVSLPAGFRLDNLSRLKNERPVTWPGNFAVNFRADLFRPGVPVRSTALRCWLNSVGESELARYRILQRIIAALNGAMPSKVHLVEVDVLEEPYGIKVREKIYPVVLTEWVEAPTLDIFLQERLQAGDTDALLSLEETFIELQRLLRRHGVAHGDLSAGNMLISKGGTGFTINLIDFDALYHDSLGSFRPKEAGHKDYQHPLRIRGNWYLYGAQADRFSGWAILLTLRALGLQPDLWREFAQPEPDGSGVLLQFSDYLNPESSAIISRLRRISDERISYYLQGLLASLAAKDDADIPDPIQRVPGPALRAPTIQPLRLRQFQTIQEALDALEQGEPVHQFLRRIRGLERTEGRGDLYELLCGAMHRHSQDPQIHEQCAWAAFRCYQQVMPQQDWLLRAEQHARDALSIDPAAVNAAVLLAQRILPWRHDWTSVYEVCTEPLRQAPNNRDLLIQRALAAFRLHGSQISARDAFEEALNRTNEHWQVKFELARCLLPDNVNQGVDLLLESMLELPESLPKRGVKTTLLVALLKAIPDCQPLRTVTAIPSEKLAKEECTNTRQEEYLVKAVEEWIQRGMGGDRPTSPPQSAEYYLALSGFLVTIARIPRNEGCQRRLAELVNRAWMGHRRLTSEGRPLMLATNPEIVGETMVFEYRGRYFGFERRQPIENPF